MPRQSQAAAAAAGIGKKRAAHIKVTNPHSLEQFQAVVDDERVVAALAPHLRF